MSQTELGEIAVTGGSGFIGSHLIRILNREGYLPRVLVHRNSISHRGKEFRGSLTSPGELKPFLDSTDTLFHLAAALGNRNISHRDFFKINSDGTGNLLQQALRAGIRKVIIFSSAGVYGKTSGTIPLRETDPVFPVDIYERSKWEAEKIALEYTGKINITILRPGWVYGEGDPRTFKLIKQIHSGQFFIPGSGRKSHSPIHINDLITAALQAARLKRSGDIFNIGGEPATIREMVSTIHAILGKRYPLIHLPVSLIYPAAFLMSKAFAILGKEAPLTPSKMAFFLRGKPLDSSRIFSELDLPHGTPFKEGMERTIRWYFSNKWLRE